MAYSIATLSALIFQYVLLAVEGDIEFVNEGFGKPFGTGNSGSDMVFDFIAKTATSIFFAYFWVDFYCSRKDPVDSDGNMLTVYDEEYMPVEIAPWLGFTVIFTVTNCLAFQQTNEMARKQASMFFPPHAFDSEDVFDKTWLQAVIGWVAIPFTFATVVMMANNGRLRYFLPASSGMVVRPFYVLAMYYISLAFGDMQTRAQQDPLERADHQATVGNLMWLCYFLFPLISGLLNAYVLKIDWWVRPAAESVGTNLLQLVKFAVVPTAMIIAVCAWLTWGVAEPFDAVVLGKPCVAPEGTEACAVDATCTLGKGECSWNPSKPDLFMYLFQYTQSLWPVIIWALSFISCCCGLNRSFFAIYVINGFSQVRFILTECTGIPFAMRTVNLNYESKDWLIGIPTTTTNTDLLAFFLYLGLCLGFKLSTPRDRFITVPIGVYKTRLSFSLPVYVIFAAAAAVTTMEMPPYVFSLSQAFMYVFGVALPAYNLWDYGWLRTMSCLLAREYNDESLEKSSEGDPRRCEQEG